MTRLRYSSAIPVLLVCVCVAGAGQIARQPADSFATWWLPTAAARGTENTTPDPAAGNCNAVRDGAGANVVRGAAGERVASKASRRCASNVPHAQPKTVEKRSAHATRTSVQPLPALAVDTKWAKDRSEPAPGELRVDAGRVSAVVLAGGGVFWLLHSGFWAYLLLLGLPLWRHVDLLPIVDRAADDAPDDARETAQSAEERAVAPVLDARRAEPPQAS